MDTKTCEFSYMDGDDDDDNDSKRKARFLPITIWSTSSILSHLMFKMTLWSTYYYPPFKDRKIEAQKSPASKCKTSIRSMAPWFQIPCSHLLPFAVLNKTKQNLDIYSLCPLYQGYSFDFLSEKDYVFIKW